MIRSFSVAALAFSLLASTASAQFFGPGYNPYHNHGYQPFIPPQINPFVPYNNGYTQLPWPRTAQFPVIGVLPNGMQVINPWGPRNFVPAWNTNPYYGGYNPYAYNPYAYNPYAYNPYGYNPWGVGNANFGNNTAGIEREPGRFIPVGGGVALNNVTGTILRTAQGVAQTNDGNFYRVPGTGSLTAWGALDPTSGLYVNPITGDAYNPGSGLIIRR
ncbi:hypothetical protein BH11PLA2_BH11PLA2_18280 [soil metagenome]